MFTRSPGPPGEEKEGISGETHLGGGHYRASFQHSPLCWEGSFRMPSCLSSLHFQHLRLLGQVILGFHWALTSGPFSVISHLPGRLWSLP